MTNAAAIERFRTLALALPGAVEGSHRGAADFRANGRIFATLAYCDGGLGTLRLTPAQQTDVLSEASHIFQAIPGGWGRMGMTFIHLDAPKDTLTGVLTLAHRNVISKPAARKSKPTASKSKPAASKSKPAASKRRPAEK